MQRQGKYNSEIIQAPTETYPERYFKLHSILGQGNRGIVYSAQSYNWQEEGKQYAIKILESIEISEQKFIKNLINEQNYSELLENFHPLIRIYDIIQWKEKVLLVMELGEQNLKIGFGIKQNLNKIERMKEISKSIFYLQYKKLIHANIQPGKFVIVNNKVKLIDFGFMPNNRGILRYDSPEILEGNKQYTFATYIWSLGCIFYEILAQESLFYDEDQQENMNLIKQLVWNQNRTLEKISSIKYPSNKLKILLENMLKINPQDRCNIKYVIQELTTTTTYFFSRSSYGNLNFQRVDSAQNLRCNMDLIILEIKNIGKQLKNLDENQKKIQEMQQKQNNEMQLLNERLLNNKKEFQPNNDNQPEKPKRSSIFEIENRQQIRTQQITSRESNRQKIIEDVQKNCLPNILNSPISNIHNIQKKFRISQVKDNS